MRRRGFLVLLGLLVALAAWSGWPRSDEGELPGVPDRKQGHARPDPLRAAGEECGAQGARGPILAGRDEGDAKEPGRGEAATEETVCGEVETREPGRGDAEYLDARIIGLDDPRGRCRCPAGPRLPAIAGGKERAR